MNKILGHIQSNDDLKAVKTSELKVLCGEIRQYIIETILENGGHFAANLGVIELTVALHHLLDLPKDILIWDVGHQAYAHKILTGRKNELHTIRKLGGLAGFPSILESKYDSFGTGHSSTSLSALAGMAVSNALNNNTSKHVAVIGDGALTAGQAYEALNHIAELSLNVLIIVNDNQMSIDANNGNFAKILESKEKADLYFTTMGYSYYSCKNGNDIDQIYASIEETLHKNGPKILHVKTKKGFGFDPAEDDHIRWHATESMVKVLPNQKRQTEFMKFQEVAGKTLEALAENDDRIIVVTPAMPTGSGLKGFEERFPDRFFDVGIAEQHAVTFSAGMAKKGFKVFCFIYSTFLQRAYDQLIHDVCLQNLPVIFCVDRAGLVGGDGATHHGAFDFAFLQPIPNLAIQAPGTINELQNLLVLAAKDIQGPIAIRYPRGRGRQILDKVNEKHVFCKVLKTGTYKAVISIGGVFNEVNQALDSLAADNSVTWIHLTQVKPFPIEALKQQLKNVTIAVTVEDGVVTGGAGQQLSMLVSQEGYQIKFKHLGVQDHFVEHGSSSQLKSMEGYGATQIANLLKSL